MTQLLVLKIDHLYSNTVLADNFKIYLKAKNKDELLNCMMDCHRALKKEETPKQKAFQEIFDKYIKTNKQLAGIFEESDLKTIKDTLKAENAKTTPKKFDQSLFKKLEISLKKQVEEELNNFYEKDTIGKKIKQEEEKFDQLLSFLYKKVNTQIHRYEKETDAEVIEKNEPKVQALKIASHKLELLHRGTLPLTERVKNLGNIAAHLEDNTKDLKSTNPIKKSINWIWERLRKKPLLETAAREVSIVMNKKVKLFMATVDRAALKKELESRKKSGMEATKKSAK